jgi:hypothetical protein
MSPLVEKTGLARIWAALKRTILPTLRRCAAYLAQNSPFDICGVPGQIIIGTTCWAFELGWFLDS